jgi:OmpA-OmpF porin, OOP family
MFINKIYIRKDIAILFLSIFYCIGARSQINNTDLSPNPTNHILNNHNKFYVGLNLGLYQFYGDVSTDKVFAGSMMKGKFPWLISPRIGWDFNERFGMRSSFGMGDIWAQSDKKSLDIYFKSSVKDLQGQFIVNLSNLVTPYFYNKKWNLNIYIGAGWMWYRTLDKNSANEIQYFYGYDTFGNKKTMLSTLIWSGGTSIGYKIAKHLDFNLEIQVNKPLTDYLDGVYRSLSENDVYSSVSVGLNYYFGKKDQEWKWNPMDYVLRGIYDTLAKQEKNIVSLNKTVNILNEEVEDTAKKLDSDQDSVPDFKDLEPNTPAGALVNWQGKHIPLIDTSLLFVLIKSLNVKPDTVFGFAPKTDKARKEDKNKINTRDELIGYAFLFSSVYFQFNRSNIDVINYKEIVRVVQYMIAHPQVKILISGNCDKIGSAFYNDALALRRTSAVKKVLTDDFNIAADRIREESNSNKKLLSQSVDDVNRRVDFFIIQ